MLNKLCLVAMLFLFATSGFAADCQDVPSCASLGFQMKLSQCQGRPVLHCPFDKTSDDAVWCPKASIGLKCMSGNYFNMNTHGCYPKNVSDYVFIDEVQNSKASVLVLSQTKILNETKADALFKIPQEDHMLTLSQFYKLEEYVFKQIGTGCYVVTEDVTPQNTIVYVNDAGIGIKLDQSSLQKCVVSDETGNNVLSARILVYRIVDYQKE